MKLVQRCMSEDEEKPRDEGELVTKHHGDLFFLNPSGGPGAEHSQTQVARFATPLKEGPEAAMASRNTIGTYLERSGVQISY